MASDFRTPLYERYVSTFKGTADPTSEGAFGWWDHKVLPLLSGLARDAPLLEIGCGSGGLLAYLARRGFSHAAGIDISAEQVSLARQRGVVADQGNAMDVLAQRARAYAAILAVDVFEHFARAEVQDLARLIYGALQPGGRLVVQTANGAGLLPGQVVHGDLTHLTIFTPQSLEQLLRPIGFADFAFAETG